VLSEFFLSKHLAIKMLWNRLFYVYVSKLIKYCVQNPASGDALTKLQDDVDETKIVLVNKMRVCLYRVRNLQYHHHHYLYLNQTP